MFGCCKLFPARIRVELHDSGFHMQDLIKGECNTPPSGQKLMSTSSVPKSPVFRQTGVCGKFPVFLWLCPSICDFGHIQSVIELFGKQVNNALSVHLITRRQRNHKNLSFARLCASLMPVLLSKKRPLFYKNKPVWGIVNTGFAFKQILLRWEQLAQLWETLFRFFYWTWIF